MQRRFLKSESLRRKKMIENDVKEVMTIMGSPHQFDEDYDPEQDSEFYYESAQTQNKRQLFRDTEEGILAGVSAGLGHYFNIDPVIIRVLWIVLVLVGGSGVLVYIIAWIAIPEAKTTAQKLRMYGQSANLDNFKTFAESVTKEAKTGFKRASDSVKNSFKKKDNTFTKIVKAVARVFGFILFFAGIMGVAALVLFFLTDISFFFFQKEFLNTDLNGIVSLFFVNSMLATWLVFAVTIVPVIFMVIAGGMLLFNQKPRSRGLIFTLLIIWFVAIVGLSFMGARTGFDFKETYKIEEKSIIEDSIQRLEINLFKDEVLINNTTDYDFDKSITLKDNWISLGYVRLHIRPTKDTLFYYTLEKRSNGPNLKRAKSNLEAIRYEIDQKDNHLNLPTQFSFPDDQKIRGQAVKVKLYVPEGKQVLLNGNLSDYPMKIKTKSRFSDDMLEQSSVWEATEKGMEYKGFKTQ